MLNFRPFRSPAESVGTSSFAPRSTPDLQLVVFGTVVLGAVIFGFVVKKSPAPAAAALYVAPPAGQVDTSIIARDEPVIWDVLLRYGRDHGRRIPAFDSARLPTWWTTYSHHPIFDYRYVLKSKYVDSPIKRVVDRDPSFFLRPVVTTGPDGRVAPVTRVSEPPNSAA